MSAEAKPSPLKATKMERLQFKNQFDGEAILFPGPYDLEQSFSMSLMNPNPFHVVFSVSAPLFRQIFSINPSEAVVEGGSQLKNITFTMKAICSQSARPTAHCLVEEDCYYRVQALRVDDQLMLSTSDSKQIRLQIKKALKEDVLTFYLFPFFNSTEFAKAVAARRSTVPPLDGQSFEEYQLIHGKGREKVDKGTKVEGDRDEASREKKVALNTGEQKEMLRALPQSGPLFMLPNRHQAQSLLELLLVCVIAFIAYIVIFLP